MDTDFIDTYGVVGYYLRSLDINTSSRIAMLSSLVHLQKDDGIEFDEFYDYSLDQTGEKLESSSFKTLISKLHKATSKDMIIKKDGKFKCSSELIQQLQKAKTEFENLTKRIG